MGNAWPPPYIFNSRLDVNQLFDFIMAEFEIPCESREKSQVLLRLNQWLLERYRAGETAVLIVDEAQNLSAEVLEEIRLLTNLETSTEKLLQIVLTGQPELEEKLKLPHLRQLRQRITLRCRTAPLTIEETFGYIAERLRIAGANGEPIFSKESIQAVHTYSHGIPRVVNLLCEHSLINAYVDSVRPVLRSDWSRKWRGNFSSMKLRPIAPMAIQPAPQQAAHTQALLDNLDELLGRLRQANVMPSRERKP